MKISATNIIRTLVTRSMSAIKASRATKVEWVIFPESKAAHEFCRGRGIEIGGSAHNPFGLNTLNLDESASMETIFKKEEVRMCGRALPVDVVATGDHLPFKDESQGFVTSSHVLEHLPNPIMALIEWDRVVRSGGTIFMIVPHKERTFDAGRERTPLEHLIADFDRGENGPAEDDNGHHHFWITEDIVELIEYMITILKMSWKLVCVQDVDDKVGNGFTVVIEKTGKSPVVCRAE